MKTIILVSLIFLFKGNNSFLFSQASVNYIHPLFDSIAKTHSVIAVLPFDVTIKFRPSVSKKTKPQELELLENRLGYDIQSALQNFFLEQKTGKKAKKQFQDCSKTDAFIMRNGWSIDSLYSKTTMNLADTFGVDAIISGSLYLNNLKSAGYGMGLITIVGLDYLSDPYSPYLPNFYTDSIKFKINLYDGKSGKLLWEYRRDSFSYTGGELENGEMHDVVKSIMSKARKKFPYKKSK